MIARSFAAGVLSALTTERLRRRRVYRPSPPCPGLRFAVPARPQGLRDLLATMRAARADDERALDAPAPPVPAPLSLIPEEAAIARPDLVAVAHREGYEVRLSLSDWPGLRLNGPGAEGALRAWIAALVTRDGPYGAEVLVRSELGERLLSGAELPSVQRLDGVEALLTRLEAAAIGRTRHLKDAEVPDAVAYWHRSPEDPFPLLLTVVGDLPAGTEARWSAVVAAPGRLGELLGGATLFQLDASTAADLLGPGAAVHHEAEPASPSSPSTPGAQSRQRQATTTRAALPPTATPSPPRPHRRGPAGRPVSKSSRHRRRRSGSACSGPRG